MGPDCQLLKISVALLMDEGRLVSVCDGLDPGTEGLPACLPGFEAGYASFCDVWASSQVKSTCETSCLLIPSLCKHLGSCEKKPLWAGVCKQQLKRATNKWWNWKSHLENFFFLFKWVPKCEVHFFLGGCFTISSSDAHHVVDSTPCKSFSRDNSTMQQLS